MVARHAIEFDRVSHALRRECGDFNTFLEGARRTPSNLHLFFLRAQNLYLAGSVVSPDSAEVARALRVGAQALTAIFEFQYLKDPPRSLTLGEGQPVTYTQPARRSDPDLFLWEKAFHLAVITRQSSLLHEICEVTREAFANSSIVGANDDSYLYMDALKTVWTDPDFTRNPTFIACDLRFEALLPDLKGLGGLFLQGVSVPLLRVLRCLGERDEASFNAALSEALEGHKRYWSSTEELRRHFDGFVSLKLTSAAALAHDRGMIVTVESDYLPMSWVRGDFFRGS